MLVLNFLQYHGTNTLRSTSRTASPVVTGVSMFNSVKLDTISIMIGSVVTNSVVVSRYD